jgi:hypothetical protein
MWQKSNVDNGVSLRSTMQSGSVECPQCQYKQVVHKGVQYLPLDGMYGKLTCINLYQFCHLYTVSVNKTAYGKVYNGKFYWPTLYMIKGNELFSRMNLDS